MIRESQKRKISSDIDNDDTNIINNNNTNVINVNINESTSDINNNNKNNKPNINKIRVQRIIQNIVKLLIKLSIYPSKEELRGATEAYLKENHIEFFSSFSKIYWTSFYNDNIYKNIKILTFFLKLLKQVHSLWGSLSIKIREAIFITYEEINKLLVENKVKCYLVGLFCMLK
ncbi:hypothetical protein C1645_731978 [Glomus cerebriforme]|uniref:Uncharacterized protein n=1 Tax=Glomus cerebriforme TaxID=658196 RepID=A0A397TM19_9GLOM|nr:hypothetical protein C1645_731978 [Glomus cerebriforme]